MGANETPQNSLLSLIFLFSIVLANGFFFSIKIVLNQIDVIQKNSFSSPLPQEVAYFIRVPAKTKK